MPCRNRRVEKGVLCLSRGFPVRAVGSTFRLTPPGVESVFSVLRIVHTVEDVICAYPAIAGWEASGYTGGGAMETTLKAKSDFLLIG